MSFVWTEPDKSVGDEIVKDQLQEIRDNIDYAYDNACGSHDTGFNATYDGTIYSGQYVTNDAAKFSTDYNTKNNTVLTSQYSSNLGSNLGSNYTSNYGDHQAFQCHEDQANRVSNWNSNGCGGSPH